MPQPLKAEWPSPKPWLEVLGEFLPFLTSRHKVYSDLCRQLKSRTPDDSAAWNAHPGEIRETALQVIGIAKEYLGWPETSIFLPDDPADTLFHDRFDGMAAVECILAIEKRLGISLPEDFMETLPKLTLAETINRLVESRKAEDRRGEA